MTPYCHHHFYKRHCTKCISWILWRYINKNYYYIYNDHVTVSRCRSLHDVEDPIDAELDDFLGDFEIELPNSTSKTTVSSAADEDNLLQEIEELLA